MRQRTYTLTLTEEQLRFIGNCVEDCNRFMAGQLGMSNTTSYMPNGHLLGYKDTDPIKGVLLPDLSPAASYSWCGGGCKDPVLKAAIIKAYPIWRDIKHFFTVRDGIDNVYTSPTLTCKGQGPKIKIEETK